MNQQVLQEMIDHYTITKVLKEYCHGCDRCDEPHMASVYTPDSWDDHGVTRNTGFKFAKAMCEQMQKTSKNVSHLLGQTMIKVDGDTAGAETYFIAVMLSGPRDRETVNQMGGRYVDSLVRDGDTWKVKHRICVRDWSITLPVERDWLLGNEMIEGQRSNEDPSYAVLGIKHSGLPAGRST